jgi:DNA topoisomerase-1
VANFGRFGPYVKRGDEFRSLATDAEVFTVTLDQAIELFNQEKPSRRSASKKVLRELGDHPDSGATVQLLEGRYGPYVSDGTTNASLPKDLENEAVTLDAAVGLLRARQDAKPTRRARAANPARRRKASTRKRPA